MLRATLVLAVALSLSACATGKTQSEREANVLETQSGILQRLVDERSDEELLMKVQADELLAKREIELVRGLKGVIKSQRALLRVKGRKLQGGGI